MVGGGIALKGASSFIRALQFLSAAFILGVFSYFFAREFVSFIQEDLKLIRPRSSQKQPRHPKMGKCSRGYLGGSGHIYCVCRHIYLLSRRCYLLQRSRYTARPTLLGRFHRHSHYGKGRTSQLQRFPKLYLRTRPSQSLST